MFGTLHVFTLWLASAALWLGASGQSTPGSSPPTNSSNGNSTCNKPLRMVMPWTWLTSQQKSAYIKASLCIMRAPPRLKTVPFAQNLWDEMQYIHTWQANYVHSTGHFLAFHRYFTAMHATMLEEVCGYSGPLPYWNETADIDRMEQSPVFQADAFGGNGVHPEYPNGGDIPTLNKEIYSNISCVRNGPFVNTTLHIVASTNYSANYCMSRVFNNTVLKLWANQTAIDICQSKATYEEHWNCMAAMQHRAGHLGIGGVMGATAINPGDVMFFLHHNWLDALWWMWQTKDLANRLTDMSGFDVPPAEVRKSNNWGAPPEPVLFYDNNYPGNTTLDHVIYVGLIRNATVREIMDVRGQAMCRQYLYGEWIR